MPRKLYRDWLQVNNTSFHPSCVLLNEKTNLVFCRMTQFKMLEICLNFSHFNSSYNKLWQFSSYPSPHRMNKFVKIWVIRLVSGLFHQPLPLLLHRVCVSMQKEWSTCILYLAQGYYRVYGISRFISPHRLPVQWKLVHIALRGPSK